MKILCKIKFGSHLYGTNTPKSDLDIKGVFMPELKDMLVGEPRRSIDLSTNKTSEKNSKEDIDETYYSLPYFLKLLNQGEIGALDMIHARGENLLETSDIWEDLYSHRAKAYSKNLKCFTGYAKKQASKYGIRGSRLAVCDKFVNLCNEAIKQNKERLSEIWNELPMESEFCQIRKIGVNDKEKTFYSIISKNFDEKTKIESARSSIKKFLDNYGSRAKLARENKGIDWKAISHALRASVQLLEIYKTGDLKFPLNDRQLLLEVKQGFLDWETEASPLLERYIDDVTIEAEKSGLPEKSDKKFFDEWLFKTLIKENKDLFDV